MDTLLAVLFATAFSSGVAVTGNHELLTYDNEVTGSAPSSSFLTPGRHTAESLGFVLDLRPPDGTAWQAAFDGRATDDPRVDPKRFNVKRLYLKEDDEKNSVVAGDYFATFSEYTLGKSLKGAQYARKLQDGTQLTGVAGIDKPNWDDLWNHNVGETVDRQVWGLRAQRFFMDDGAVGVSVVAAKDERAIFDTSDVAVDQRVFGLDWSLPRIQRLSLSGESAYSFSQLDTPTTDENFNPINAHTTVHGWAHKVRGRYAVGRFKTVDEFERVSPDFQTTVGAASPDLVRVKTNNTLTIAGPWKWIVLNYTFFHNSLFRREGDNITTTRMPETGLRYEAPDWRPDLSVEVKLRHREATSSQDGLRRRTRSVIAGVSDRLGPVGVTVDYEYQHEDKSDGSSSARHHILGLGTSCFKAFENGWKLTQGLRYDLQRDRDNLIPATDQTGTVKANALVVSPWAADAGVTYSRSLVLNALFPGNDRRAWVASIGYNVLGKEAHRVELRFRRNDNRFQSPGQDYKETTWEFALNNRF